MSAGVQVASNINVPEFSVSIYFVSSLLEFPCKVPSSSSPSSFALPCFMMVSFILFNISSGNLLRKCVNWDGSKGCFSV